MEGIEGSCPWVSGYPNLMRKSAAALPYRLPKVEPWLQRIGPTMTRSLVKLIRRSIAESCLADEHGHQQNRQFEKAARLSRGSPLSEGNVKLSRSEVSLHLPVLSRRANRSTDCTSPSSPCYNTSFLRMDATARTRGCFVIAEMTAIGAEE